MRRARPLAVLLLVLLARPLPADDKPSRASELIDQAMPQLLACEEEEKGLWPYEGVYRVEGKIPVGYRIGGTSIVANALLHAGSAQDKKVAGAIDRAIAFVVQGLDHPLMKPSREDAYDVRVWGHAYALELLCRVRAAKRLGPNEEKALAWNPKLVAALVEEELEAGGWNYAGRRAPASFVTAPVVQSLLLARSQGEKVPDEVLARARKVLEAERDDAGYFAYSGVLRSKKTTEETRLPGSIARSAVCETTLLLLGGGSKAHVKAAIEAFHEHWAELEKRRKKKGTHEGPYAIAPYYFYYGHRYVAQAIEQLDEADRAPARERLLATILKTRDEDGTWNDRVFPRSRNFGTAMCVLALLGEKQPVVPGKD
jgi:hypothetical protein